MASRLNPYLSFGDNAREALTFYQQVLGGELTLSTFGEFGTTEEPLASGVMHGQLVTPAGYTLMASDTPPGMERREGSSITISLSGDDADDLRGYFAGLSEGGTVQMPLEKQMWGDVFGQVVDKFGTVWIVNIAGDAA
ncbi:MAG: Glyoxalase/bleomycin resistance protein/dioxygenase [Marmoricola sp.]|nr:Glyoxalase/bleomycin resistance protein/dioxygenase [Marmoricola sp.]